jgi:hypothetical protein
MRKKPKHITKTPREANVYDMMSKFLLIVQKVQSTVLKKTLQDLFYEINQGP